jgi:hypothetical protein
MSGECFVCLSEGGERFCSCSLRIHEACLVRMVTRMPGHPLRCAQCRDEYPLHISSCRTVSPVVAFCYGLLLCHVLIYVHFHHLRGVHYTHLPVLLLGGGLTWLAHLGNRLHHGSWFLMTWRRTVTVLRGDAV